MIISAKSLKNPQYLSTIVSKLISNSSIETEIMSSRLPKLDETLDEDLFNEEEFIIDENKKKKI
jgi:hypothetical protein